MYDTPYTFSTYNPLSHVDKHNEMENTTSRLAVRVHKYPPFPFQWNDKSPQMSRCEADGDCLRDHMLKFMMSFMVKELKSLSDLAQFVPSPTMSPAHKSEILPLKLLFRDEKSIDENIQILVQYIKDASLDGSPQVHYKSSQG